jgi:hypothetical protein
MGRPSSVKCVCSLELRHTRCQRCSASCILGREPLPHLLKALRHKQVYCLVQRLGLLWWCSKE